MASLNRVTLIGNLGKDPRVAYMTTGECVTNITIATTETWKDKDGQKQEKTEWHRVTFYRKLAEIAGEYLRKGSQVYIQGKLETKKWADKKTGEEKYSTEIVANEMQMLGGKREREDTSPQAEPKTARSPSVAPSGGFDDMDDDIPF